MRKLKHEEIPRPDPDSVHSLPKHPIRVIVENVRSIYNVGSIFRSSDAALIEKIYLTGISGTPENRALHKTALGAQDTVEWEYVKDSLVAIERCKRDSYAIAVLEITDEPQHPTDVGLEAFPMCLVVGNELHGVDERSIEVADIALEIPQFGAKQSLNVSVAYGVAVFDLVRRFRDLKGLDPHPSGDIQKFALQR